jgi:DNA-binding transcriptional MocR family regulator
MNDPNYNRIAETLGRSIEGGQLRAGERLLSVRALAQQQRVSPTTAVAALRLLEQRGQIEARARSGYFVTQRPAAAPLPKTSRLQTLARGVDGASIKDAMIAMPQGAGIVPLGSAIPAPTWFPARNMQRRIARIARREPNLVAQYGPLLGLPALRHQIVRRYAQLGCHLDDDEVMITNGCTEAMNIAIRAVAEPGATIAVESPAYFGILQIIESFGMKALEIATHPTDGLSLTALEQALGAREGNAIKACVVVSSFSNPIGATLSDDNKKALVRLCHRFKIALIEDDIYGDLNHGGRRPPPAKAFDSHGTVIMCSSFSKSLAPGARIGWVAGAALINKLQERKAIASYATPLIMQHALADYLADDNYERHLRKLRQSCAAHVDRFSRAVAEHFPQGTRISRPDGGFVLWVEMPSEVDATALQLKARREKISVLPGTVFSASGRFRHCLRINCGQTWSPRIAAAVQTLGRLA